MQTKDYQDIDYDLLVEGKTFRSQMTLTEEFARTYCESIGWDYQPDRLPPSIFAVYRAWFDAFGGRVAQGTVHLKQSMEHYGSPAVGDELAVEVTITEKSKRKGRDYLVWEALFRKGDQLLCRQTATNLWAYSKTGGTTKEASAQ